LRFLEWLGKPLRPGARVLDLGCGIGQSVDILLDMGYDVHGVDVVDWWDRNDYWDKSYVPGPRVRERLYRVDEANYRIPFPDGHFEFCLSDQVMEHVHGYTAVFAEIMRVLKPQAVSVHRFPGHAGGRAPVLAVSGALLLQCISRHVGHLGSPLARPKGPYLASDTGVEHSVHEASQLSA
jgi:SAM-dependent methyltransferase